MDETDRLERVERLLLAIAAMLAAERDAGEAAVPRRRTEVVLNDAGLGLNEIGAILGRSPEAVRSALRRSHGKAKA